LQIIDYSGVAVSSILGSMFSENSQPLSISLARHTILNALKKYNLMFRKDYGKMIIACDNDNYWRKEFFPYYKCKRAKAKEDSFIDWNIVHEYVNIVKKEIHEYMPWIVVEVEKCEADDIIFTLAPSFSFTEPVMIVSRDHDFKQLQTFEGIKQYNPVEDRMEVSDNPSYFLFEHIVQGDSGDSIPNIFSPENSFALGIRQKPATQKRKEDIWNSGYISVPPELKERYELNEKLVAFYSVPEHLQINIQDAYDNQYGKKRDILKYFQKFRLSVFTESLQDFI
jgi:hypothetical protein